MIVNEKSKVNKKKVKKDELTISSQLRHINIIDYYGFVEINDKVCIIMEYTPFGNLRMFTKKIMKTDYLSESILCYLTYQILNGLKYCHKSKIAHLDIKPENIVVFNCLNIIIIDFSMSLDYSKIKSNKIILRVQGTRFYIAPEILSQKLINVKDLNKIDLYSLGVTLYNLTFDHYPFGLTYDDDYKNICNKILTADLIINNEENFFSSYFVDFLTKILEKDIKKRININEALNHYWIKGANILFDEKEKIFDEQSFVVKLITNSYKTFNDYLGKLI